MVRIAAAQITVTNNALKNLNKIIEYIKKAASKNVDIVCFPEASLVHSKNKKTIKKVPIKKYINIIKKSCKENKIHCIFGTNILKNNKLYNSAFFIDDNDVEETNEQRRGILEDYSQENSLEGLCMLSADGGLLIKKQSSLADRLRFDRNNFFMWQYEDDGTIHSVQEWIDEQDGKYLALLLNVCNPLNLDVQSQSSILFVPDNEYSIFLQGREVNVRMYVPGIGYIDDVPNRKMKPKEILWMTYVILKGEITRALSKPTNNK